MFVWERIAQMAQRQYIIHSNQLRIGSNAMMRLRLLSSSERLYSNGGTALLASVEVVQAMLDLVSTHNTCLSVSIL